MAKTKLGQRLGARVRARREAQGWSQAEVAERVRVSKNYVGLIERGLKVPTVETLVMFAKTLGVSTSELLGDATPPDEWLNDVSAIAATVPKPQRGLALALLRAIATHR